MAEFNVISNTSRGPTLAQLPTLKASYGPRGEYGWEIDHKKPKGKGGVSNLSPPVFYFLSPGPDSRICRRPEAHLDRSLPSPDRRLRGDGQGERKRLKWNTEKISCLLAKNFIK